MTVVLAAALVATGLLIALAGVVGSVRARRLSLERLLDAELAQPSIEPAALADLVERAGAFAERALARTSMPGTIQSMLSQAGWSMRTGEFAAVLAMVTLLTGALVRVVSASLLATLLAVVAAPLGCVWWLDRRGARRTARIEEQLPNMLRLLAGSLESGSSVLHGFELIAEEGDEPMSGELARVVAETQVGRPLTESLDALASRVGSRDLEWTVEAIRIQHATGGRLADTLRVLADFMGARMEVKAEVRALSAEARLSAKVLTALPILVGGYLAAFRPVYVAPLASTSGGRAALAIAGLALAGGIVWMRRIVRVEV